MDSVNGHRCELDAPTRCINTLDTQTQLEIAGTNTKPNI